MIGSASLQNVVHYVDMGKSWRSIHSYDMLMYSCRFANLFDVPNAMFKPARRPAGCIMCQSAVVIRRAWASS